jgi:hypothetical protein
MTAVAELIADSREMRRPNPHGVPEFILPDPGLSREEGADHYEAERDRLARFMAFELDRPEDEEPNLLALAQLSGSIDVARRRAQSSSLPRRAMVAAQETLRRRERVFHQVIELMRVRGWLIRKGYNNRSDQVAPDGYPPRTLERYGIRAEALGQSAGMRLIDDALIDDELFERALSQARSAGTMARSRVKEILAELHLEQQGDRIERIRDLAGQGLTSAQIGDELGLSEDFIRRRAAKLDIAVPGDHVTRKQRKRSYDPSRVLDSVTQQLEGISEAIGPLDADSVTALPREDRIRWSRSLQQSIKALRDLHKELTNS